MKTVIAIILLVSAVAVAQSRPKRNVNVNNVNCPTSAACTTFNQMKAAHDEDIKDAHWACFYTESSTTRPKDSFIYAGANPASITAVEPIYGGGLFEHAPTTDEFFLLMDGSKAKTTRGFHPGIWMKDVTRGLPDENWYGFGPEGGGLPEAITADWADENSAVVFTFDDLGSEFRFSRFHYTTPDFLCFIATRKSGCCVGDSCKEYSALTFYDVVTVQKSTGRFVRTQANVRPNDTSFTDTFAGRCFRLNQ